MSCLSVKAQSFFSGKSASGTQNDLTAEVVAQLSDTLNNTSSLFYWQDRLWTLNDHGNIVLYAIDSVTGVIDTILDTGLPINDMEEVAQDNEYFYFGDFGNNHPELRQELYIYRMSKANLLSGHYVVDTTTFLYYGYNPNENDYEYLPTTDFDCEAMVAAGDSLYLFTKQWSSTQTVCYVLPKQPGTYTAARCDRYDVDGLVTGAWLHPETSLLVLCGYNIVCQPFVCIFYDFQGCQFFSGEKIRVALTNGLGTQTEAITSKDGLHYFLTNERFHNLGGDMPAHLLSLDLSDYLYSYFFPDTGEMEGIGEVEPIPSGIKVYPNPTTEQLLVDLRKYAQVLPDAFVVIYDSRGREVLRRPATSERMQISVKEFPAGQYLVGLLHQEGLLEAVTVMKL